MKMKCRKMVVVFLLDLAILVFPFVGAPLDAAPAAESQQLSSPEDEGGTGEPAAILHRVYEMSLGSASNERVFVLRELAKASLGIDRELAAKYAREVFEASLSLPMDWFNYRRSSQMNAVRLLASSGAVQEAAELFERMDPPEIGPGGKVGEDLREVALLTLIPRLIKADRAEGLDWALRMLRRLGASGNYPYMAAQQVIQELLGDEPLEAEGVYGEAIAHFEKEKELFLAREIFVGFLLSFEGKFTAGLERQGVLAAVDALLKAKTPENQRTMVRLTLENGATVRLERMEDRSLFRLMPLLAKYQPERAEEVLREKQPLRKALEEGGAIQHQESILVIGTHGGEGARLGAIASRQLEWQRARRVGEVASGNLEQALDLAGKIDDTAPRAGALAAAAAAVAREDPGRAGTLLAESLSLMEKVEDPPERLRLLNAILRAYVRLEDGKHVADTYAEILELGAELLEQERLSDPQVPLYVTGSFQRLSEATKFAARVDPQARLLQLARLEKPALQWHLMIDTARTMADSRR